jgi:hypothetical protein
MVLELNDTKQLEAEVPKLCAYCTKDANREGNDEEKQTNANTYSRNRQRLFRIALSASCGS